MQEQIQAAEQLKTIGQTKTEDQVQRLERQIRSLQKKLNRSQADRRLLEENNARTESLLTRVIAELQASKQTLEERGQTLEALLTELQATQSQLIESEKMSALGILVAGIAHEINNPVSFIYGNLAHAQEYTQSLLQLIEAYQHTYSDPPEAIQKLMRDMDLDFVKTDYGRLLESIHTGAERIYDIVGALRNFSRLDEAEQKEADLHMGLDSTLSILSHRLKPNPHHNGINLVKRYGDLPKLNCYPGKLNQVFMNILSNAIDALEAAVGVNGWETEPGDTIAPTITIETVFETDQAIIHITNNGPGIPAEVISNLFNPFFTTKPVGKGTGLGLSISYQIVVEQHHGQILCHSDDDGTTFTIRLPVESSGSLI